MLQLSRHIAMKITRSLSLGLMIAILILSPLHRTLQAETFFAYNSGRDYLDMREDYRDIYVQGLLDQWSLLMAIYDDYDTVIWLEDCAMAMRSDQVAEMFTDWLEWHQEDLDLTAPELFVAALLEICEEDL